MGGVGDDLSNRKSNGTSSDASNNNIPQNSEKSTPSAQKNDAKSALGEKDGAEKRVPSRGMTQRRIANASRWRVYDRKEIAAPIMIEGEKYYMAVMVQKDHQSNRMYMHDVITEKATLSFTNGANHRNGEGIRDKGHLFITNILQNALFVKSNAK